MKPEPDRRRDDRPVVRLEVRDRETMEAAIALSTPHANNAAEPLDRIINMFPRDQHNQICRDLPQYLRAIMSQRLVVTKDV